MFDSPDQLSQISLSHVDSDINKSRISLVEESLLTIAGFIDFENNKGSAIQMHVIMFNHSAQIYHQDNKTAIEFIKSLSFDANGSTNFKPPNDLYKDLYDEITLRGEEISSMFISDGHSTSVESMDFESIKPYDFSLGIGQGHEVDMKTLQLLSNNSSRQTISSKIEMDIIQKMFDNLTVCYKDVTIDVYIPPGLTFSSSMDHKISVEEPPPPIINSSDKILSFRSFILGDLRVLNVKPILQKKTSNKHVVFVVDISTSMNSTVYTSEDNIICDFDNSILLNQSDSETTSKSGFQTVSGTTEFNSVFTDNTDITTWRKYRFEIFEISQFYNEYMMGPSSYTPVTIVVTHNERSWQHILSASSVNSMVPLFHHMTKCSVALNTIVKSKNKNHIRELYVMAKNKITYDNMVNLVNTVSNKNALHHKFYIMMKQIDEMYMNTYIGDSDFNIPNSIRQVSLNQCRQISASIQNTQQTFSNSQYDALEMNNNLNLNIDNIKICINCNYNFRQVVYSCGHLLICNGCNDKYKYNRCQKCYRAVRAMVKVNISTATCITEGCVGIPVIVDEKCSKLVFCETCWIKSTYVGDTGKKRKIPQIQCSCKSTIETYVHVKL